MGRAGVVVAIAVALLLGATAPASAVDPSLVIGGGLDAMPVTQPAPPLLDLRAIAEEAATETRLRDCANRLRAEHGLRRRHWSMVGENLARGTGTPEAVCDAWIASPSHRAVLLQRRFLRMGAGFVQAGGTGWYAEVLGELERR